MHVVLDACTLINLINGQILKSVSLLPGYKLFIIDNLLEQEILNESQRIYINVLVSTSVITIIESPVTVTEFLSLKEKYDLGAGELECIALCRKQGLHMASDDRKARKCAAAELQTTQVIGSLYFLKALVQEKLVEAIEAKECLALMKKKGAYLPNVDEFYFL